MLIDVEEFLLEVLVVHANYPPKNLILVQFPSIDTWDSNNRVLVHSIGEDMNVHMEAHPAEFASSSQANSETQIRDNFTVSVQKIFSDPRRIFLAVIRELKVRLGTYPSVQKTCCAIGKPPMRGGQLL